MSTINVSNYIKNSSIHNNKNKEENEYFVQAKDILTATVKNKTDEYITLKGQNVNLDIPTKDVIFDGSDTVSFEVLKSENNQIELKQINYNTETAQSSFKQMSSEDVLELFKQNNLYVEEDVLETDSNAIEEQKTKEILKQIQNDILYATNNTSESAISELLSSNIDITKVTLDILTKVTNAIDKKPFEQTSSEEIESLTNKYIQENNLSAEGFEQKATIVKALKDNGLNTTNNNISKIENAVSKFENAVSKDNFQTLADFNSISIDQLAEESYSNSTNIPDEVSQNEDLYEILANKLGLTYDTDLKKTFNTFLANDIAIEQKTLDKVAEITSQIKNITFEDLVSMIAENLSKGEKASDTNILSQINKSFIADSSLITKTLDTKQVLLNATQNNIASLIKSNTDLTISNIKTAITNNDMIEVTSDIADTTSKTYKDLLTLMHKLTFEASTKLAKSGIDIDTQTVTDALNTVIEQENKAYEVALISSNIEVSEENTTTVKTFMDNLSLLTALNTGYKKIDGDKIISDKSQFSTLFKNSELAYGVFETKASSKWQDAVTDYTEQIESILEDLKLENTQSNIEACEILIRSKIDLTEENIVDVKTLNLKLDKIMNTLHPKIVTDMLSDGINPLSLDVDEILEYVDTYENLYGDNLSDKLAKNILSLQKDSTTDEETIQAMKSFYKALNIVLSNEKASIGAIANSSHQFTVKNMLDTAKYYNQTKGVKSMINEQLGDEITQFIQNENSIESIINNVATKSTYEKQLIDKIATTVTNDALANIIENSSDFEQAFLESIASALDEFNQQTYNKQIDETDVQALVTKLNQALQSTPFSIKMLLENNVPINVDNLATFRDMLEKPTELSKKLKNLISNTDALNETFKEISEDDLTSISGTGSILDIQIGEIENSLPTNEDILLQKTEILSNFNLMNLFNKNQDSAYSQMAIKLPLSDELTTLNMYVIDDTFDTKQTKTIIFSLDTEFLGNIEASLKINLNNVDININGDSNGIEFLKQSEEEIKELFLSNGYTDVTLNFLNSDVKSIFYNSEV